ncbi:MAG: hypothetical protein U0905_13775 [Pirellulales bacterium]
MTLAVEFSAKVAPVLVASICSSLTELTVTVTVAVSWMSLPTLGDEKRAVLVLLVSAPE